MPTYTRTLNISYNSNYSGGPTTSMSSAQGTGLFTYTTPSGQTIGYIDVSVTIKQWTPSRSGYSFQGWSTSSSGSVSYRSGESISRRFTIKDTDPLQGSQTVTLYAVWTSTSYTISYNGNGSGVTGVPSSQTKRSGQTIQLSSSSPSRSGYSFQGWATSSTGLVKYQPGSSYSTNANLTLYAVWLKYQYSITYNSNGATGTVSKQEKGDGDSIEIKTSSGLSYSGKIFYCWTTNKDGTGTVYVPGQSYSANANLYLYAQFLENPTMWVPEDARTFSFYSQTKTLVGRKEYQISIPEYVSGFTYDLDLVLSLEDPTSSSAATQTIHVIQSGTESVASGKFSNSIINSLASFSKQNGKNNFYGLLEFTCKYTKNGITNQVKYSRQLISMKFDLPAEIRYVRTIAEDILDIRPWAYATTPFKLLYGTNQTLKTNFKTGYMIDGHSSLCIYRVMLKENAPYSSFDDILYGSKLYRVIFKVLDSNGYTLELKQLEWHAPTQSDPNGYYISKMTKILDSDLEEMDYRDCYFPANHISAGESYKVRIQILFTPYNSNHTTEALEDKASYDYSIWTQPTSSAYTVLGYNEPTVNGIKFTRNTSNQTIRMSCTYSFTSFNIDNSEKNSNDYKVFYMPNQTASWIPCSSSKKHFNSFNSSTKETHVLSNDSDQPIIFDNANMYKLRVEIGDQFNTIAATVGTDLYPYPLDPYVYTTKVASSNDNIFKVEASTKNFHFLQKVENHEDVTFDSGYGYSQGSYKLYKEIPSNSNLNSYVSCGSYTSMTAVISSSLSNCPTEYAFVMEVQNTKGLTFGGAPVGSQTAFRDQIIHDTQGNTYRRRFTWAADGDPTFFPASGWYQDIFSEGFTPAALFSVAPTLTPVSESGTSRATWTGGYVQWGKFVYIQATATITTNLGTNAEQQIGIGPRPAIASVLSVAIVGSGNRSAMPVSVTVHTNGGIYVDHATSVPSGTVISISGVYFAQ